MMWLSKFNIKVQLAAGDNVPNVIGAADCTNIKELPEVEFDLV